MRRLCRPILPELVVFVKHLQVLPSSLVAGRIRVHLGGVGTELTGDELDQIGRRNLIRCQRPPWIPEQTELNGEAESIVLAAAGVDAKNIVFSEKPVADHRPVRQPVMATQQSCPLHFCELM